MLSFTSQLYIHILKQEFRQLSSAAREAAQSKSEQQFRSLDFFADGRDVVTELPADFEATMELLPQSFRQRWRMGHENLQHGPTLRS